MNVSHIVVLIIRLFAVWLAVHVLQNLAYSLPLYEDGSFLIYASLGLFIAYFCVAAMLWFFPHTAAEKLTGVRAAVSEHSEAINADQFAGIAYGIVGVYLLYNVITDSTYWYVRFVYMQDSDMLIEITADQWANIIATGVQAVMVLVLILGHKKINKIIQTLRG